MNDRARLLTILFGAAALLIGSDHIAAADPTPYGMRDESSMEAGCFGPCKCPVMIRGPVRGTFLLTHTHFDGLYDHYAVTEVDWTVPFGDRKVRVKGSGSYRVGGEVALQQQLSLDLTVDGRPEQRFESGLVPGGGSFPKIDVSISVHGAFCFDTVFNVRAAPLSAAPVDTTVELLSAGTGLHRVSPNPFREHAEVELTLRRAGAVDLGVFDLLGREVRSLARGMWLGAGAQSLSWDGRREDGSESAAGLYFVRLRAEHREYVRAVVKLR